MFCDKLFQSSLDNGALGSDQVQPSLGCTKAKSRFVLILYKQVEAAIYIVQLVVKLTII